MQFRRHFNYCQKAILISLMVFCILGLGLVSPAHSQALGQSWKPKALQSVAMIQVQQKDGSKLSGMTFLALKDGLGITALNVIKDAVKASVVFPDGEEYGSTGIVDRDEKNGVALVKLRIFGKPLLSLRAAQPTVGEQVFCLVNKEGDFGVVEALVGEMTSAGTAGPAGGFLLKGSLPEGNSGAPVFDKDGAVIGMLHWKWKLEGDKGYYFLIPAAAIMALDSTLPTQPWPAAGVVAASEARESAAPSEVEPLENVDALLAEACLILDTLRAHHDFEDIRTSGKGYLSGVGTEIYTAQQKTEQILKKIAGLKINDPVRKKAVQAVLEIGSKRYEAVDAFIKAVVIGQEYKDWGASAKDMYNRSQASWQIADNLIEAKKNNLIELYNSSQVFKEKLRKPVAFSFGILERPTKLDLGVVSFPQSPLYIIATKKVSFAEKLGFWSGDKVISVAGRTFGPQDTLEDLKIIIMNNLGQQVEAVVERNGKEKILKLKIPREIPAEYLRR